MNLFKQIFRKKNTPEERRFKKKKLLFGLLSGLLLGLSFPPIPLPYLIFIGLVPYFFILEKLKGFGEINRFTYYTAFIFNLVTLYWVGSWTPDADTFLMIAGTALMFFNPILFLIPSTLFYFSKKIIPSKYSFWLFPLFWVFYEYAYSITEFRFPWLTLGNSLPYFSQFVQIADIIGVYGLSLFILYINISIYSFFKVYLLKNKIDFKLLFITLILFLIPMVYGVIKIDSYKPSGKYVKVGLIQPNLNPWKKWEAGSLDKQLDLYLALSDSAVQKGAELIVWPETALPVYLLSGRYGKELATIKEFLNKRNVALITGMPNVKFYFDSTKAPDDAKPVKNSKALYTSYNSILGFNPHKDFVQTYGKIKLVPFGEKIPYVEDFPLLGKWIKWNVGISSWNTGRDTVVMNFNLPDIKLHVGAIVCIESIYPGFVAQFVKRGADLIAVVTNDSWYGNSSGPYQHKEISVLRAVENRRTVVRAANGGISCIINPLGKTVKATGMFRRTYLTGKAGINKEKTFYTQNPLLIPYITVFVVVLTIFLFLIHKIFGINFSNSS